MTRFRVHLENGEIVPVDADTPADAAAQVRKARKGAIVRKVKRDKSDKPSKRHQMPFYRPNLAAQITETGQRIVREVIETVGVADLTKYEPLYKERRELIDLMKEEDRRNGHLR